MFEPPHEWSAEVSIDEALVRRLIGGQFPALAMAPMRPFAEGWDNAVWLVDETWAFRMPRRQIAIAGVEREIRVLPQLGPILPLPIPVPTFVGHPDDGYPWPFFGARLLPGRELADADPAPTDTERQHLARPLALFLRALHAPTAREAAGADLPIDVNRRADMEFRVPRTLARLEEGASLGLWPPPASAGRLLAEAIDLPPPEPTALVHGDLHVRHLLVDDDRRLTGVIDWGDLCVADPSLDLSLAWALLAADGRAAFLEVYGPVTDAIWLRARVIGLFLCATLAIYAHHEGMAGLERESIAGVQRAGFD